LIKDFHFCILGEEMLTFQDYLEMHGEDLISAKDAFEYARKQKHRVPELEGIVVKNAIYAAKYAVLFLNGQRWPEDVEKRIARNSEAAYTYAKDVLKRRWPEAEKSILKVGGWVLSKYAEALVPGRWLEAEPSLMKRGSWNWVPYLERIAPGIPHNAIDMRSSSAPTIKSLIQWAPKIAKFIPLTSEEKAYYASLYGNKDLASIPDYEAPHG
jgi:hypothetical protein